MKILVSSSEHSIRLGFPTGLVFSSGSAWLAETVGRKYAAEAMQMIPKGAVPVLFRELRHLKRKYGPLVLVEVESADGSEKVKITL